MKQCVGKVCVRTADAKWKKSSDDLGVGVIKIRKAF